MPACIHLTVHRGEHFRHARNAQGKSASSSSLSSHAHNRPTLPLDLIYPAEVPETPWVPGPNPPRSWLSPPSTTGINDTGESPAWRARALSLLFSTPSSTDTRDHAIHPDPSPVPPLTLLCLQRIRATCPGADLADAVPFIPRHLRRALLRNTAVHAPLSQTELDVLCGGASHVDTELIVVGPGNTLRASALRRNDRAADDPRVSALAPAPADRDTSSDESAWDAAPAQDSDDDDDAVALRSLTVLSSPLSAATLLAFPPTITHLALIRLPHAIPLPRLPTVCPLLVLLDVSYNAWLYDVGLREPPMLEQVKWVKLRQLEVLGLRECRITPKILLELNRSRWEDVRVIR